MGDFQPHHINATSGDLQGNNGRGRCLLLPGSPGRAEAISQRLTGVTVKRHPRGHDLHLGTLTESGGSVDVGVVATGMGGPSVEIIVTELLELGGRFLLRVGTAGSLQDRVRIGDLVVATGAVRDDGAGRDYLPVEFPALASLELIDRLRQGAGTETDSATAPHHPGATHCGVVHSKDSLYAREFSRGPLGAEHGRYEALLKAGGVLASEMECATLFAMASVAHQAGMLQTPPRPVLAGAILAVIGDTQHGFAAADIAARTIDTAIDVALRACAATPTC